MIDWFNWTATVNAAEVADLVLALVGVIVSAINLAAARQRLREWVERGHNGAVLIAARTAVRHETYRVLTQLCFVGVALVTFRTRGSGTLETYLFHAALLAAMALVLATSVSSMTSRRALERHVSEHLEGGA